MKFLLTLLTAVLITTLPAEAASKRLVQAIIKVESNGNPKAKGRAGEYGLMQIKCATARSVGFKGNCSRLLNPKTNVKYGTRYLNFSIKMSPNLDTAISRYNRGVYSKFRGCSSYCRKVKRAMR